MIVVEGPDGAGKTTLIKQLVEELGLPVAPRVVSKGAEAMTDLRTWVDQNLDEGFQPRIFDRHRLISETIYGPILRHHQEPGFDQLKWIGPRMRRFYDLEPIIIYCLPPLEEVMKNISDDPDNVVVVDHIEAIYSAYVARAALDHTFAPGIVKVWDYTSSLKIEGLPSWMNEVRLKLRERNAA